MDAPLPTHTRLQSAYCIVYMVGSSFTNNCEHLLCFLNGKKQLHPSVGTTIRNSTPLIVNVQVTACLSL